MNVNVNNHDIVNFSMLSSNGNFICLAAKMENETFFVWINPPELSSTTPRLWRNLGYEWRHGKLYWRNKQLPTQSLSMALGTFLVFLSASERGVILVDHSSESAIINLLKAIQDTESADMFRNIIVGFADSLLILRAKYHDRKHLNQFSLPNLSKDLLGKAYTGAITDVSCSLDIMAELTTRIIEPSDYEGFITSYEEAVSNETIAEV